MKAIDQKDYEKCLEWLKEYMIDCHDRSTIDELWDIFCDSNDVGDDFPYWFFERIYMAPFYKAAEDLYQNARQ